MLPVPTSVGSYAGSQIAEQLCSRRLAPVALAGGSCVIRYSLLDDGVAQVWVPVAATYPSSAVHDCRWTGPAVGSFNNAGNTCRSPGTDPIVMPYDMMVLVLLWRAC